MKTSISYLSSIYDPKKTIKLIQKTTADYIHVDIMDGKFVERNNFDINIIKNLNNINKKLDIHLMTLNPKKYFNKLKVLNPEYITFHYEAVDNIQDTINTLKRLNIKVGISLKPNTSVERIIPYIDQLDLILIMTVEPGAGGQKFMENQLDKVKYLSNFKHNNNANYLISVDGGINDKTVKLAKNSGVDMIVSGSFICKHENYQKQLNKLII